jgi:glycosyltransferase involved in cell wall biosynthesis
LCRVSPELQKAAERIKADLYIAHNIGALPAALGAARRRGAKLGFDAEDFHSGMSPQSEARPAVSLLTERLEKQILPQCNYVTAASPLIADMYASKYAIPKPTTILNVFPLEERPKVHRDASESTTLSLYWFSQTIGSGRGLEDVVRAMGMVKEQNIELHLLGDWQPRYKTELTKLATSVGLPRTRIQAYAPVPPSEMVKQAANYDVGLALEQSDSLNRDICLTNKIFTYLLAGNAVIATATSGQQKLIREIGKAGYCYEAGDVEKLAAQLRFWCMNRTALVSARQCAWSYGTDKFNWDLEKSKFLHVVKNVLRLPAKHAA